MSEVHGLRRVKPKLVSITEEEIADRMRRLSEMVASNPLGYYPAIREMFPKKVKMIPEGKAVGGRNLYSMSGRILLNKGLAVDFERLVKNVAVSSGMSSGPCDSDARRFSTCEIGVTNGT